MFVILCLKLIVKLIRQVKQGKLFYFRAARFGQYSLLVTILYSVDILNFDKLCLFSEVGNWEAKQAVGGNQALL